PNCTKVFHRKHHLVSHLVSHTQDNPFVCSIAGRGFKRKHHLESHLTTHTAECPYKCNLRNERGVCTSKFKRQGDLARHQRNVHK
ncbi:hypothetical protein BC830DRAFT_1066897, partial [Chytriomyces sp. MP71]